VSPRSAFREVTPEVEYALARLIEREINRLRYVERVRMDLQALPKFSVSDLFSYLDVYELGFISEN
jgi:hypothetical protein